MGLYWRFRMVGENRPEDAFQDEQSAAGGVGRVNEKMARYDANLRTTSSH